MHLKRLVRFANKDDLHVAVYGFPTVNWTFVVPDIVVVGRVMSYIVKCLVCWCSADVVAHTAVFDVPVVTPRETGTSVLY